jgi:hypothetical protein
VWARKALTSQNGGLRSGQAQRAGKSDAAMVDITGENISIKWQKAVEVAGLSPGAAEINCLERDRGVSFTSISDRYRNAESAGTMTGAFYLSNNEIYGHHNVLYAETTPNFRTAQIWRPGTGNRLGGMEQEDLNTKYRQVKFSKIERKWKSAWQRAGRECIHGPSCKHGADCKIGRRHQQMHIFTGAVLDIWSRIGRSRALATKQLKVVRCEIEDEQRIVGLLVPEDNCPRPPGAVKRPKRSLAFSYENPFCVGLLYGRAGRLNTKNAGFRPGQWRVCWAR